MNPERPPQETEPREEVEKRQLKNYLGDIILAERWLMGDFRKEPYRKTINAELNHEKYPEFNSSFQRLEKSRDKIILNLKNSKPIKKLRGYKPESIQTLVDYCNKQGISLSAFDLTPLAEAQRIFDLPEYLDKLSSAKIIISNILSGNKRKLKEEPLPQPLLFEDTDEIEIGPIE